MSKAEVFAGVAESVIRYIDPTIKKIQMELNALTKRLEHFEESTLVFMVKGQTYRVCGDAESLHKLSERFCRLEYLEKTYEPEK